MNLSKFKHFVAAWQTVMNDNKQQMIDFDTSQNPDWLETTNILLENIEIVYEPGVDQDITLTINLVYNDTHDKRVQKITSTETFYFFSREDLSFISSALYESFHSIWEIDWDYEEMLIIGLFKDLAVLYPDFLYNESTEFIKKLLVSEIINPDDYTTEQKNKLFEKTEETAFLTDDMKHTFLF